ncbi:MAG: NAD(P)-binding domain-containing protein, partial [Lachnospiraceae bacterium]|nr:NAD(P)-binding domain-containing protein [Lachnospiraceae bacterium]
MIDLEKYRHYHFIGIGGIGMSALAEILLSEGYQVSGSDMKRSEITDHLASLGAEIFEGHAAENVENADIVIYTVAIPNSNPEYSRAVVKGIPLFTRAELLGEMMRRKKYSIAISGAHGKTTTTSMISLILEHAGFDPTLLVGGNLPEIHGNVKIGQSDYLVTESCEYKDSFLDMRPSVAVILNIAEEHLDYFTGGISQIKSS